MFRGLHGVARGVVERTLDERGHVREHVHVFVDGKIVEEHDLE